jgi:hypothetical protein
MQMLDAKQDYKNPCNINLFVGRLSRFKNWSYAEQALAFQINRDI